MSFEQWLKSMKLDAKKLSSAQKRALRASYKEQTELKAAALKASQKNDADPEGEDDDDDVDPAPALKKGKKTLKANLAVLDLDDEDDPMESRRHSIADEEERVDAIRGLFASARYADVTEVEIDEKKIKVNTLKAKAIRENWTPDKVEKHLLLASYPEPARIGGIHVKRDVDGEMLPKVLSCALGRQVFMMKPSIERCGRKFGYEEIYSDEVLEASDHKQYRGIGLHQLMDMTIEAAGKSYSGSRKSDEFGKVYYSAMKELQASSGPFSTLTVTNILEDAGQKFLLQRFMMANTVWQEICRQHSLSDFKPQKLYRMDENLGYLEIGGDGRLKHGQLTDTRRTIEVDTFGRIIGITRKHRINDDLGAFVQVLSGLADGAVWNIEALVFAMLLDSTTLFTVPQGNLITDELGLDGLQSGVNAFKNLVGAGGKPIQSTPSILLTGTTLSPTAERIYVQENLLHIDANGAQIGEKNMYRNKYRPVESAYIDNVLIKKPNGEAISDNQSDTAWWLLSNPELLAAIEIGFLNGSTTPIIESAESSFDTLGMQWRGYHDVGVSEGDFQAGVMSTGEGSG